jgi:hypothetical protein
MSEYDFGISYIKGKENVVADALSRRPRIFSFITLKVNLREHVLTQLCNDPKPNSFLESLTTTDLLSY